MFVKKFKIALIANTSWYVYNFRLALIRSLIEAGCEVVVLSPPDEYSAKIAANGVRIVELPMNNKGMNPIEDLALIGRFYRSLRRKKPDVLLTYTIKPNVYASLAARLLRIPVINNVSGLGRLFIEESWVTAIAKKLYRLALRTSSTVFFQNDDDLDLFVQARLVKPDVAERLPGSGVDTCKFAPVETGQTHEGFRFLLASRMLWDKGIGEFVDAARLIRRRHPEVQCQLLGFLDVPNPTAISKAQMQAWVDEGAVAYLGTSDRVETLMQSADCIVLPSYREGVPRSLLEAASLGKPIITTDAVGCRDVVDDGVNGFLCKPRDAEDLADKMIQMIELSEVQRSEMGRRGREKMLREFDERIVIERYLSALDTILAHYRVAEPI